MDELALGAQLFIEDAESHLLRGCDLGSIPRQADFEGTYPAECAPRIDPGALAAQQWHCVGGWTNVSLRQC
jgi:hypothetical protein